MHRAAPCLVPLLLSLLASGGCATTPVEKMETITGTVTYFQRIAMPPGATVELKLVEVRRGSNKTIVEKMIGNPAQVPVSFTLAYNSKKMASDRKYAVQARILVDGKPWYVTQTVNHQMRNGRIAHADIILQPFSRNHI
jgi:putative lipoprotein